MFAPIRRVGRRAVRWALVGLAVVLSGAASHSVLSADPDAAADRPRNELTLPGAVTKPPEWLVKDAPFDVAAFFKSPPPEENAAPLYLDALYEFDAGMEACFPSEERARRSPVVRKRTERFDRVFKQWEANPASVDPKEMDSLLAEYDTGFRKLAAAQKRKQCVFQTGIDLDASTPYPLAARAVARVGQMRISRHMSRDAFFPALRELDMISRLSRDFQSRGITLSQLVSVAMRDIEFSDVIPKILASPHLTTRHCDDVMAVLLSRQPEAERFLFVVQAEYLLIRRLLHDAETMAGALGPKTPRSGIALETLGLFVGEKDPEKIRKGLEAMPPGWPQREVKRLDKWYRLVTKTTHDKTLRERLVAFEEDTGDPDEPIVTLVGIVVHPIGRVVLAMTRDEAFFEGTRCLVALRRWELAKGTPPPDLETVCRAAGMKGVPIDPYSRKPLRMATIDGRPVIYSVGLDGKDDHARVEWDLTPDDPRGDILFRLPKRK